MKSRLQTMFPELGENQFKALHRIIAEEVIIEHSYKACDDLVPTKWNNAVYEAQSRLKTAQAERLNNLFSIDKE